MSDDLDFTGLDGSDDIDWSDVEAELQQNREMLRAELDESKAAEAPSVDDAFAMAAPAAAAAPAPMLPDEGELGFLMEVPLLLTVEVGKTRMKIKDLLNLELGSIIELRKKIGAPMNVLINDKLVAKGEIVIQNEKFGLKISHILDDAERMRKLKMA